MSEDILDMIEDEAGKLSVNTDPANGSTNTGTGEAGQQEKPQPEPEPQREQQPDGAFDATSDIVVNAIKDHFRKKFGDNKNIDKALACWDDPKFSLAFVAVLKKYNLSIFNLPVEAVLAFMIYKTAKDFIELLREGQADAATA